jgi:large subunit ribosomal protein L17
VRHRKAGKKLGRNSSHRRAMFRNMVTSLFKHEQIETTDAKAKQLRPVAEKMITLAKRGDLHARRQVLAYMKDKAVTHRLFEEIKDRYLDRQGGYVRIVKKGTRKGDSAPISVIQLLPAEQDKKKGRKKGATGKSKEKTPVQAKKAEKAPSKEKETEKEETQ